MRKKSFAVGLTVLALLSISVIVYAQSVSKQDSYIVVTQPSSTTHGSETTFWVQDSTTSCNDTRIAYLQADLTPYSAAEIESVTLTIKSGGGPVTSSGATLTLYGVSDISGGVNGVNTGNDIQPPIADDSGTEVIQQVAAPTGADQTITFGAAFVGVGDGGNASNLADYMKTQAGGIATFALSFSAGCANTSSTAVFYSLEHATAGNRPSLTIWNPTSISINAFSAEMQSESSLLWLAIALPLCLGVILLILRRRQYFA